MEAIAAELSVPISEVFADISSEPLASGSVAQTHRATLLNGKEVVIKIQRPHLPEIIEEDLELLIGLSRRIPKAMLPMVNLSEVLQTAQGQLDERNRFS